MSAIAVFSASHCRGEEVAEAVASELGWELVSHSRLLEQTAERFEMTVSQLDRALWGQRSVFNRLTHEKERCLARVRLAVATRLAEDGVVLVGPAGHLVPRELTQVLRVALVADPEHRVQLALASAGGSQSAALKLLRRDDQRWQSLTLALFGLAPWDNRLHDLLVPMHSASVERAVELIRQSVAKPALRDTPQTRQATRDFGLASEVQLALADGGHDVEVRAASGHVTLIINRYTPRLDRLRAQLAHIAERVAGVEEVETKVGPHYKQPDIYLGLDDSDLPPKILLVDDEEEFVLTLSERLEARNLESAVAHNGEEALAIVETDSPDVMVLDLKMPGIDGLEVLRRVKQERPQTEVIILTGHGSDKEQARARELGAFAYLNKPVDIDVLTATMKQAYERTRHRGPDGEPDGDPES